MYRTHDKDVFIRTGLVETNIVIITVIVTTKRIAYLDAFNLKYWLGLGPIFILPFASIAHFKSAEIDPKIISKTGIFVRIFLFDESKKCVSQNIR